MMQSQVVDGLALAAPVDVGVVARVGRVSDISALYGPPPRRRAIVRAVMWVAFAWAFALLNILAPN